VNGDSTGIALHIFKISPAAGRISKNSDILIALLCATQMDGGMARGIGYFYSKKSPEQKIIGIRTDFHRAGESQGSVVKV